MAKSKDKRQPEEQGTSDDFSRAAGEGQIGILAEFWDFLLHNKKWWITPIVVVLLLVGLLVVLSTTAVAPFIYTIF